ncbi:MAG: hypothetical protein QW369_04180 [Desulfurococcaceae archaeon]
MTSELREFNSIEEFIKYIDSALDNYRRKLAELLRLIEDARVRAGLESKLSEYLAKLTGSKVEGVSGLIDLKIVKIALSPSPKVEVPALEQLAESINNKITLLQSLKKSLESVASADISAKLSVIVIDDLPKYIFLKL